MYVAGLDLGQARDYTALAIIETSGTPAKHVVHDIEPELGLPMDRNVTVEGSPARLRLRHLERFELGTSYPDIAECVVQKLRIVPGECLLAVDATGVGAPVIDMFDRSGLQGLVAITITGGSEVHIDGRNVHVPKRDIVHGLLAASQEGRFKVAKRLQLGPALVKELTGFQLKVNLRTGHDQYEAWRESVHDDLVLAVALAAWVAELEIAARAKEFLEQTFLAATMRQGGVQISPI